MIATTTVVQAACATRKVVRDSMTSKVLLRAFVLHPTTQRHVADVDVAQCGVRNYSLGIISAAMCGGGGTGQQASVVQKIA